MLSSLLPLRRDTPTHPPTPPPPQHPPPLPTTPTPPTTPASMFASKKDKGAKSDVTHEKYEEMEATFYDHEGRLAKKATRVGNLDNDKHDRALER